MLVQEGGAAAADGPRQRAYDADKATEVLVPRGGSGAVAVKPEPVSQPADAQQHAAGTSGQPLPAAGEEEAGAAADATAAADALAAATANDAEIAASLQQEMECIELSSDDEARDGGAGGGNGGGAAAMGSGAPAHSDTIVIGESDDDEEPAAGASAGAAAGAQPAPERSSTLSDGTAVVSGGEVADDDDASSGFWVPGYVKVKCRCLSLDHTQVACAHAHEVDGRCGAAPSGRRVACLEHYCLHLRRCAGNWEQPAMGC